MNEMSVEHGSTSGGSGAVTELLDAIERQTGVDYHGWRAELVDERVRAFLRAEAIDDAIDLAELTARLSRDRALLDRLPRALAHHEPTLFADPAWWRTLRERAVPLLRTYPFVDVWVPGCGDGEAAFAAAILLAEEGLGERSRVWATEAAEPAIERARGGQIEHLESAAASYLAAGGRGRFEDWCEVDPSGVARLVPALRGRVLFAQHNLATDGSFHEFQLVLCRGQLAELDLASAGHAHESVRASLCQLGLLALGPGESLDPRHAHHYERFADPLAEGALYRRLA